MSVDHHPDNPARPVAWRWERAGEAAAGVVGLSRRDDAWVAAAAAFRRDLGRARGPQAAYALAERHGVVYWAHRLHDRRHEEDGRIAPNLLEARVLARQGRGDIARMMGTREGVVEAYEALFFDVASRLDAPDYMLAVVFGPALVRGLRSRDFDLLWKLAGYRCGPHVLERLVNPMPERPAATADGAQGAIASAIVDAAQRNALIAHLTTRPTNDMTAVALMIEYRELMRLEREAGAGDGEQKSLTRNVQAMLLAVPFAAGDGGEAASVAAGLGQLDLMAGELRGDQVVRFGLGLSMGVGPSPGDDDDACEPIRDSLLDDPAAIVIDITPATPGGAP